MLFTSLVILFANGFFPSTGVFRITAPGLLIGGSYTENPGMYGNLVEETVKRTVFSIQSTRALVT